MPEIDKLSPANGRMYKEDSNIANIADIMTYGVKRTPVKSENTASIAASGTGTATVSVPAGKRYFIKQINITKGADISITAQNIDSNDTGQAASFDCESVFGGLLTADTDITVSGSNAGVAAENLTIEVIGYSVEK
jgi:hypothetical protein